MAIPISNDNFSSNTAQAELGNTKSKNTAASNQTTQANLSLSGSATLKTSEDTLSITQANQLLHSDSVENKYNLKTQEQAESMVMKLKDMFAIDPQAALGAQLGTAKSNPAALLAVPPE